MIAAKGIRSNQKSQKASNAQSYVLESANSDLM